MARYSITGSDTNTNGNTLIYLAVGATTRRFGFYHIIIGSRAAPADNAVGYDIQRFTAENGTPGGTAVTPQALDPADPAALANAVSGPTGAPTYTANAIVLHVPKNMRQNVQWVAADQKGMLLAPATNDSGLGVRAVSPSTAYAEQACVHFDE